MRKYVTNFSLSILLFFIFTIIASVVLALLSFNGVMPLETSKIIIIVLSLLIFGGIGFFFGMKSKKRGMLNGILLALAYGIFLLLYYGLDARPWTMANTLINSARVLMILGGTILGVNLSRSRR